MGCLDNLPNNEEQDEDEEDMDFNPLLKEAISLEASSSLSSELEGLDGNVVESNGEMLSESAKYQVQSYSDKVFMQTIGTSQPQNMILTEEDNEQSLIGMNNDNAVGFGEFLGTDDEEDAICKRTRARYSLAQFTLDELENFLQETDDDDDLQNVDDEEEYRKFLSAVLQGGNGDGREIQENQNVDDDDEDNDADFELEIEEALESDVDENIGRSPDRRPETRQNRKKKVSVRSSKKNSTPLKRPLRPLMPNVRPPPFPVTNAANRNMLQSGPAQNGFVTGFAPHQIGQLHCLIYEHVQLLVQIFSLCILDPARQHIASQVQRLIVEMNNKRNELVGSKRSPYPSFCFSPQYIQPSMSYEVLQLLPAYIPNESLLKSAENKNTFRTANSFSPSKTLQTSFWMPLVNGAVSSVLDVAPLNLVGSFMDDVSNVVQEHKKEFLGFESPPRSEREPLFPYQSFQSSAESNDESSPSKKSKNAQTPKKTMAATLVEMTKKKSLAAVPRKIADLARRFFPLFNPGLYPHKPPTPSMANRVLFTDAEDRLLARGMMEYNTDWKAINERFLPSKSEHQIFVRQKNRSSSNAPENPIKAVRRMKNAPLSAMEINSIAQGMKVHKLDWMSVCRLIVPHRDPSLLPRQWRMAHGTQKSYKSDPVKKEKRRRQEFDKRNRKYACREMYSGDDCVENEDETYVHEAFLSDWRPSTSAAVREQEAAAAPVESQAIVGGEKHFQTSYPSTSSSSKPNLPLSSRSPFKPVYCRPYRSRKDKNPCLVKLAPGLPPVNLPPTVRVMSLSAFKTYQGGDVGPVKTQDKADLQMHPLLFQAPENGRLPYYPLNGSAAASSSTSSPSSPFNLFPSNQAQLNVNLFHNTQQTNQLVNFFEKSSQEGRPSSSFDINFHPLLQRADDVSIGSTKSSVDNHTSSIRSPHSKSNELDLEINLSYMSKNKKVGEERGVTEPTDVSNSLTDFGDRSLPEIVMEQEELSDSEEDEEERDEDIENVEFECEEMADSEDSESEQV
jgi:hypothetical protein